MVGAVVAAAAVGSARHHGSENSRDLHYAAGCGGLTGMAMRGVRLLLEGMTRRLAVITVAVLCCPIAVNAQDTFGRLVAASLTMTFFIYIFVNMAMVTGQLPVVGIPLPLVSYGGTSIVTIMAAFGILMSVQTHRKFMSIS